ncbi:unnamed protein product [Caenorhabditis bovis]|uniref:Uncharacterized protein n=1 Tax=Caenorhabditis bovis TaxID=2654633 RepID=A0A8S1F668_9PELO|nr:unnamed protein product [Caenorhabditis bovis]
MVKYIGVTLIAVCFTYGIIIDRDDETFRNVEHSIQQFFNGSKDVINTFEVTYCSVKARLHSFTGPKQMLRNYTNQRIEITSMIADENRMNVAVLAREIIEFVRYNRTVVNGMYFRLETGNEFQNMYAINHVEYRCHNGVYAYSEDL